MKLLCLLTSHAGHLLSREDIYQEIWNNYGGAEEGLTQAISILRKALSDKGKKIIETVPKKGYILHAVVTAELKLSTNKIDKILYHPIPFLVAACLAIGSTFTTIQLLLKDNNPPYPDKSREVVMTDELKLSKSDHFMIAEGSGFSKPPGRTKKEVIENGAEKRESEISGLKNVSFKERIPVMGKR
jgi:DNA-binding winged helix-turn-helix (wHTH) protein